MGLKSTLTGQHHLVGERNSFVSSSRARTMDHTTPVFSSSPRVTARLLRMCLFLNIMVVVVVIFVSAWYFPPTTTSGMVEQVIRQGDMSLFEIPTRTDTDPGQGHGISEREKLGERIASDGRGPSSSTNTSHNEASNVLIDNSVPAKKPRLRVNPTPRKPTVSPSPTDERTLSIQPQSYHLTAEQTNSPTASAGLLLSISLPGSQAQSMQELLRRMKTTILPMNEKTSKPASQNSLPRKEGSQKVMQVPLSLGDGGIQGNLVLWLASNEGVEVENMDECMILGTACEIKAWKSKVKFQNNSVDFRPIASRIHPVLVPRSQNGLSTVSVSCGFADASGVTLQETTTLFFVLAPSEIEAGDTYRGQKFFGTSPYGQFLLHGGKPASFTEGGLVESSFSSRNGEFLLITYRIQRQKVEIKTNGIEWVSRGKETEPFMAHVSRNGYLALGNVKPVCDTNSFQGRIAEVLVYETALSNARIDAIERYLFNKWWGERPPKRPPVVFTSSQQIYAAADGSGEADITPTNTATTDTTLTPDEISVQAKVGDEDASTLPRKFDSEGVFEWLPSPELLAAITRERGIESSQLVVQWKEAVSEKVASIRNFQFGGEILRAFIRERRDELVTRRENLFGGQ